MTMPAASVVLRRLADEAVRPYSQQMYAQQSDGFGGQNMLGLVNAMSESQRAADDTARTCAYSFAASLRAVAEEFERCEAADAAAVRAVCERVEAAHESLADWKPEPPVSGVAG